jgi:hypothetical protein
MPTPTYVPIQTVTTGSNVSSIDFSSVPTAYTHLILKASLRTTQSTSYDYCNMRFNDDAGSNYINKNIYQDGSTLGSAGGAGLTYSSQIQTGLVYGANSTSNRFAINEIYIHNYRDSNGKTTIAKTGAPPHGTYTFACLWNSSSTITKISLLPNSGFFVPLCTATLYGLSSS